MSNECPNNVPTITKQCPLEHARNGVCPVFNVFLQVSQVSIIPKWLINDPGHIAILFRSFLELSQIDKNAINSGPKMWTGWQLVENVDRLAAGGKCGLAGSWAKMWTGSKIQKS